MLRPTHETGPSADVSGMGQQQGSIAEGDVQAARRAWLEARRDGSPQSRVDELRRTYERLVRGQVHPATGAPPSRSARTTAHDVAAARQAWLKLVDAGHTQQQADAAFEVYLRRVAHWAATSRERA